MHLRSQRIDLPAVLSSARRLCHAICSIVKSIVDTAGAEGVSEAERGLWKAIRRLHGSILEAMDLLQTGSTQPGGAGALMSDLAKVLTEMLNCLSKLAVREQVSLKFR